MPRLDDTNSMPEGPAVQRLIETLRTVAAQGGGSIHRRDRAETLREHTFAAVDELKREGLSATDVLFVIEALVAHAGVAAPNETLDTLTAWSVQRYFNPQRRYPSEA
jgi:hypothetical protein